MSAPVLRLGLIGCGRIAEQGYLPALAGIDSVELTAVADPDHERRQLIGRLMTAEPAAFGSAEELIASRLVDAVVVAGPVDTHLAGAEAARAAGLPCLVEKPPAPDAAGAARMAALDPAPYVGFNRRFQYHGVLSAARPAAGLEVEIELSYRRRSWRPLGSLGDAWLDLGPHLADLALLILGDDVEVEAAEIGAAHAAVRLRGPAGVASLGCAVEHPYRESLTIHAAGVPIASSSTAGPLRGLVARFGSAEPPLVVSLRDQLREFDAAARGSAPKLLATAADGARAMEIVDRVRAHAGVAVPA